MRGKHAYLAMPKEATRNIPAHAGKTGSSSFQPDTFQEHPRACGENRGNLGGDPELRGTSPRMRGKLRTGVAHYPHLRNIPAHAGKTSCAPRSPRHDSEHPRACGENVNTTMTNRSCSGTSPRMRGKPMKIQVVGSQRRNIPAHAGKT